MLGEFIRLVKGFALSRALMSALEMGLFLALESPMSRADLREELGIADTGLAEAFFDLLIASGVLRESDVIELAPLGRSVISEHKSVCSWAQEMVWTYQALDRLTPALRNAELPLARLWSYKSKHYDASDTYSVIMDRSAGQLAKVVAKIHDFGQYDHVVDFGGGYGRVVITLARHYPRLKVTVADLPEVCAGAQGYIPAELQDRVSIVPHDFLRDPALRCNADAALLVRVLHDWPDPQVAKILGHVAQSLRRPGTVLVIEPMRECLKPADVSDAVTGLMLACMGGQRRSVAQISEALLAAGCEGVTVTDVGLSSYRIVAGRLP